ncbi:MAG: hypothetical protein M1820_004939 [Bogoriella megaspora]|nr:MAG: hypothetical protein M1820_004939 [Bogoriella megaspora]
MNSSDVSTVANRFATDYTALDWAAVDGIVPHQQYVLMPDCSHSDCMTIFNDYALQLKLPESIKNLDPVWRTCSVATYGNYDPPHILRPLAEAATPTPDTATVTVQPAFPLLNPPQFASPAPTAKPAQPSVTRPGGFPSEKPSSGILSLSNLSKSQQGAADDPPSDAGFDPHALVSSDPQSSTSTRDSGYGDPSDEIDQGTGDRSGGEPPSSSRNEPNSDKEADSGDLGAQAGKSFTEGSDTEPASEAGENSRGNVGGQFSRGSGTNPTSAGDSSTTDAIDSTNGLEGDHTHGNGDAYAGPGGIISSLIASEDLAMDPAGNEGLESGADGNALSGGEQISNTGSDDAEQGHNVDREQRPSSSSESTSASNPGSDDGVVDVDAGDQAASNANEVPHSGFLLTQASHTYTVLTSDGYFVVDSSTLTPGAVFLGQTVSPLPGGVALGSSTYEVSELGIIGMLTAPASSAASFTQNGHAYTVIEADGSLIIRSSTISPGAVFNGQVITTASNGFVIGSETYTFSAGAGKERLSVTQEAVFTQNGHIYTAHEQIGVVVINSSTFKIGAMFNGQTISEIGSNLVIGKSTIAITTISSSASSFGSEAVSTDTAEKTTAGFDSTNQSSHACSGRHFWAGAPIFSLAAVFGLVAVL